MTAPVAPVAPVDWSAGRRLRGRFPVGLIVTLVSIVAIPFVVSAVAVVIAIATSLGSVDGG